MKKVWGMFGLVILFNLWCFTLVPQVYAQSVRVYPSADAGVTQIEPGINVGSRAVLYAGVGSTTSPNMLSRFYVKFDLSPIPAGKEITSAHLKMYQVQAGGASSGLLLVLRSTANWSENTITWDNKPSVVNYSSQNVDSSVGYKSFDVTNLVKNWYRGDWPNYGLAISGGDMSKVYSRSYSSRESGQRNLFLEVTYATTTDRTAPAVSNIKVTPDKTSAAIGWYTDELLKEGVVQYGISQSYGKQVNATIQGNSHRAVISGLNSNTPYYYNIKSVDYAGNTTNRSGAFQTLSSAGTSTTTTVNKGDLTTYIAPLSISKVGVTNVSSTQAQIYWTTNIASSSKVTYGESRSRLDQVATVTGTTTNHKVTLKGLKSDSVYYYYVTSVGPGGQSKTYPADPNVFRTGKLPILNTDQLSGGTGGLVTNLFTGNNESGSTQSGNTNTGVGLTIYTPEVKEITSTSAKIEWVTNKSSTGLVKLWQGDLPVRNIPMSGTGTFHSVRIDGLMANTQYLYKALSETLRGEAAVSEMGRFTTAQTGNSSGTDDGTVGQNDSATPDNSNSVNNDNAPVDNGQGVSVDSDVVNGDGSGSVENGALNNNGGNDEGGSFDNGIVNDDGTLTVGEEKIPLPEWMAQDRRGNALGNSLSRIGEMVFMSFMFGGGNILMFLIFVVIIIVILRRNKKPENTIIINNETTPPDTKNDKPKV